MKEREEEGRPCTLTSKNKGNQKQEQQEELVDTLRKYITQEEKIFGEYLTREEIVRMKLEFEEESENTRKKGVFQISRGSVYMLVSGHAGKRHM
jgi:hypothetical protein